MRHFPTYARFSLAVCLLLNTLPTVGQEAEKKEPEKQGPDLAAVDAADIPAGHSQHGEAFNQGPRQAAYLMPGTGTIHFPVTSADPQVQKFIEQGIGQLHGYWFLEAERSFREAAMLDPECAIAYWGMAMANRNNKKRAPEFMAEALKHRDHATEREAMYIDALNGYVKESDKKKGSKAYVAAFETIVERYPEDLEAKAALAYGLYRYRSNVGKSYEDVDKALKELLALDPTHPAHHFRIHLWDTKDAAKALDSAAQCGDAAPSIAHMWHMPGHIYSRLKRYEDAVWQQEASARVDHANIIRDRLMPDQIHNFAHNNEWLIRNLIYIGRWRDAADLARNMIELPQHPRYNTLSKRGSAYYGRSRLFSVLSLFEQWDALIEVCQGPLLLPTSKADEQVKRLKYLGIAYAQTKQPKKVAEILAELQPRLKKEQELDKADKEKLAKEKKEKKKKKSKPRSSTHKRNLEKAVASINGHVKFVEGKYNEAMPLLKTAGDEKVLHAKAQCLAGEKDAAIKAIAEYVKSQEKRTLPLAGQVEVLWHADKKKEAKQTFEELRKISSSIQFGTPAFDRLASIAKELKLPEDWRSKRNIPKDFGQRPALDKLGPFRWHPSPAPDWTLKDHQATPIALKKFRGKPTVIIFYLGYSCLHCAEQLQKFAPMTAKFREAGVEVVAISTDNAKDLAMSVKDYEGTMPIPLVTDSELNVFKKYRVYDDFEKTPLHGTFLLDSEGLVRWQDISYEPFMDPVFVLREAQRLCGAKIVDMTPVPPPIEIVKRPDVDPAGISGSLLISGSDLPSQAIDRFQQLAQGEKARLVIVQFDNESASQQTTKRLQDHLKDKKLGELKVVKLVDESDSSKWKDSLNSATGIWLVASDEGNFHTRLDDLKLEPKIEQLMQRGGAVAGSSEIAHRFAEIAYAAGDSQEPIDGLKWFPASIIDVAPFATDKNASVTAALQKHPNWLGYEIEANAALVLHGRHLHRLGDGKVRIHFAPSKTHPAKQVFLADNRNDADITALRLTAARRMEPLYPAKQPPAPKVEKGTLIIIGGGGMPKGIISKFVKLAGGDKAKILVLPTAMPDPLSDKGGIGDAFRKAGAKDVKTLTGRTLDVVEGEEYLKAFGEATGIWFGGGRQWRFADAYLGTKVHKLMLEMLQRGGVIMGSSAGASIQGGYLARANPLGNLDIMADGYERGLDFLPGAAIDQHFKQRGRFKDMTSLVNRYPQLLGIGIDEGTALVVTGQQGAVEGKGQVHFYDRGKPVVKDKPDYESVADTGSYDLVARKILNPGQTEAEKRAIKAKELEKFTQYGQWLLEKYDTNSDGKLSADETSKMRYSPKDADKNKDKSLSLDEIVAWLQTL